jgi:glycosyltransferase involved in cell wall biosynthesis
LEPFTDDRTRFGDQAIAQLPSADVINLHWIRRFIDLRAFFSAVSVPVVWTLHDMNAFTGGCHYDEDCGKYIKNCGACPQLGSNNDRDLSRKIWKRKEEAYSHISPGQMHIVALCRWMKREVERSSLLGRFPVTIIPNGVDTDQFSPRDGLSMRRALGIPESAKVLLFVAQSTTNRRKGFGLLKKTLQGLQKRRSDLFLLSVGAFDAEMDRSANQLHLGRIQSDRLLSSIYSAADVFVIPSLQDNLPNTVLEAMACGTPVVGFDTGGIPDMVRPGETGWLAEVGDVRALREATEQALSDDGARARIGHQCRSVVEEEYTLEIQAERYRRLYEDVLKQ